MKNQMKKLLLTLVLAGSLTSAITTTATPVRDTNMTTEQLNKLKNKTPFRVSGNYGFKSPVKIVPSEYCPILYYAGDPVKDDNYTDYYSDSNTTVYSIHTGKIYEIGKDYVIIKTDSIQNYAKDGIFVKLSNMNPSSKLTVGQKVDTNSVIGKGVKEDSVRVRFYSKLNKKNQTITSPLTDNLKS